MKTESKHTPGPWTIGENHGGVVEVTASDDMSVAENVCANDARLIAAAPELLSAARDLVYGFGLVQGPVGFAEKILALRAAIARADAE